MSVEALRQTCAKSGATVESLRKQITEMKKEINGGTKKKTFSEITQLQTDVGRLKKQLNEKVCYNIKIQYIYNRYPPPPPPVYIILYRRIWS